MQEQTERKYEPAPLTQEEYGTEQETPTGKGSISRIASASSLITTVIISLIIVFFMNTFIMPTASKRAYIADITRLENDLVAMREIEKSLGDNLTTQNSRMATALARTEEGFSALLKYATKEDLGNYALKENYVTNAILTGYALKKDYVTIAELENVKKSLNSTVSVAQLNTQLGTQNLLIESLKSKLTTLEVEITKLKTTPQVVVSNQAGMSIAEGIPLIKSAVTNQFTIHIVNNSNTNQEISFNVLLVSTTGTQLANTIRANLSIPVIPEMIFSYITLPNTTEATQILFVPNIRVVVTPVSIRDLVCTLTINTTASTQWNAFITNVVIN